MTKEEYYIARSAAEKLLADTMQTLEDIYVDDSFTIVYTIKGTQQIIRPDANYAVRGRLYKVTHLTKNNVPVAEGLQYFTFRNGEFVKDIIPTSEDTAYLVSDSVTARNYLRGYYNSLLEAALNSVV